MFVALLVVTSAAAAQQPGTPATTRNPLGLGQERTGALTEADSQAGGGRLSQTWAYQGRRGERAVLELRSEDFDALLTVVGPGIRVHHDDDGAGACDARVTLTPGETGLYWIVVSSVAGNGTGDFRLRAATGPTPDAAGGCTPRASARWRGPQLDAVPVAGHVAVGGEVRGELGDATFAVDEEHHAAAYELAAAAGDSVTVDLVSDDFDAYLLLTGPGLRGPLADDDGGGACHARISFVPRQAGTHRLIVSTIGEMATGGFTLRAARHAGPRAEGSCDGDGDEFPTGAGLGPSVDALPVAGSLSVGAEVQGALADDTPTLRDGSHALVWTITGREGQSVTLDLVSEEFDSFLIVTGPGLAAPITDDDGGGACHARLAFAFPLDGTYRVAVNAIGSGTGRFVLRASERPGPRASGRCGT